MISQPFNGLKNLRYVGVIATFRTQKRPVLTKAYLRGKQASIAV
jgi:hypothetical protein